MIKRRVGRNVRRRWDERGWSQQHLAERVGVRQPYIVQIEAGTKGVSLEVLEKLARTFRCSMGELLGERPRSGRAR